MLMMVPCCGFLSAGRRLVSSGLALLCFFSAVADRCWIRRQSVTPCRKALGELLAVTAPCCLHSSSQALMRGATCKVSCVPTILGIRNHEHQQRFSRDMLVTVLAGCCTFSGVRALLLH